MHNTSRKLTQLMYALGCAALLCIVSAGSTHADAATETIGVVNLNTATAEELERLPRVGPTRAQAILALRAKLTQFVKVEQLLRVKGIGRATFRKLRPLLTLSGPTTLLDRKRSR
ncbi:MAG TPA: ComEA family DNA-binding protein [Polyangiales bacterium]|nr:ComEA family DNA-binding protein [Polyangiales bacterium]